MDVDKFIQGIVNCGITEEELLETFRELKQSKSLPTHQLIDVSQYQFQYPDGSCELLKDMSKDNLVQALASAIDIIEYFANDNNSMEADDWLTARHPNTPRKI